MWRTIFLILMACGTAGGAAAAPKPAALGYEQLLKEAGRRAGQVERLAKEAEEAFDAFRTSPDHDRVVKMKWNFFRKRAIANAMASAASHQESIKLEAQAKALEAEYDRLLNVMVQKSQSLQRLAKVRKEARELKASFRSIGQAVAERSQLARQITGQRGKIQKLDQRQKLLERKLREAQAQTAQETDPTVRERNQGLIKRIKDLLTNSANDLEQLRTQQTADLAQAKTLTGKGNVVAAEAELQRQAAQLQPLWENTTQELADSLDRADEVFYRSVTPIIGAVSGGVTLQRGQTVSKASADGRILPGDVYRTGRNGRLALTLETGTRIYVGADSTVEFTKPETGLGRLKRGLLRFRHFLHRAAYQRFTIRSPGATLAVRGTDYLLRATPEKTTVIVNKGKVNVQPSRSGEKITLTAKQQVVVTADGKAGRVVPVKDYSNKTQGLLPNP